MAKDYGFVDFLWSGIWFVYEVLFFWQLRIWRWLHKKSPEVSQLDILRRANQYEEWEAAAIQLDLLLGNDIWRGQHPSKLYNYKLINSRVEELAEALDENDILKIHDLLRSGLARNLGGILNPKLYNKANAGTKELVEEYGELVVDAVKAIEFYPSTTQYDSVLSPQTKLNLLHDTRLAYGRSVLVLQGGSMFGICHLGVVKALYLRGLLPRIIAGTATGALMAAMVCTHTDDELLQFLNGKGIDISAFAAASEEARRKSAREHHVVSHHGTLQTMWRRIHRVFKSGFVLDPSVLRDSAKANLGDTTFEEAFERTKRVLNITISSMGPGMPTLLNYLTAPNVIIWSAALASTAADPRQTTVKLMCKLSNSDIVPWNATSQISGPKTSNSKRAANNPTPDSKNSPLSRLAELFNVNHFLVSQARPYVAPFLTPSVRSARSSLRAEIFRLVIMEIEHRLAQLDTIGWLWPSLRRLLLDERVPGPQLTLVPEVSLWDFARMLRNPTAEMIDHWILRGERCVWPHVSALRVRLMVEFEIEQAYQLVRRADPVEKVEQVLQQQQGGESEDEERSRKRKRPRASSMVGGAI